jgi:hypothetical protein
MQQPPRRSTLGETVRAMGPETIAAALSVVVVIALAAFLGTGGLGAGPVASMASPTPSVASGGSAVPASLPPGPSASATRAPWTTAADTLLATDQRLLEVREDLRAALAADVVSTAELVRELRAASTLLQGVQAQSQAAADAGLTPDVLGELDGVHDDALDIVVVTLRSSIQNDQAYRDGAAGLVEALTPLRTYMTRLARASGLPPPVAPGTPSPAP